MNWKRCLAAVAVSALMLGLTALGWAQKAEIKHGYVAEKDKPLVDVKVKPATDAGIKGQLPYGMPLTWKQSGTKGWARMRDVDNSAPGFLPVASISEKRPARQELISFVGKKGLGTSGGAVNVPTAATRSLSEQSKAFAERRKEISEEDVIKIEWLEAQIDGDKKANVDGLFPDKPTRDQKGKSFNGGTS